MKTLKELERERTKKENAKISNLLNSYKRDDISIATKNFIIKKLNWNFYKTNLIIGI